MDDRGPFSRVIVEKPIGQGLQSAREVNATLCSSFDERQIFRIDHYLGKETVQNILVMRFGNSIFEPLWNAKHIDHLQITVAEQEGVGTRAGYYEGAGALRDMVQNHILQLLSLMAMEPPWSMDADVIRDHRLDVLHCLRPLSRKDANDCVVRPLLIGDLPTALWWAGTEPPALAGPLFDTLADLSDQVIYDSVGWPNPARGVQVMGRWVKGRRQTVFNLAWRRLKPWRRIIAQVLNPAVAPGALRHIDSVEIVHGPHALSMAWLLIGWLAARLGWVADDGKVRSTSEVGWGFRTETGAVRIAIRRSDQGDPQIETLRANWHESGTSGRVSFSSGKHARIRVVADESTLPPAVIPSTTPSPEAMVAAQLAHRERDPSFEYALGVAETMAGVLR